MSQSDQTCKTCKHWRDGDAPEGYGKCAAVPFVLRQFEDDEPFGELIRIADGTGGDTGQDLPADSAGALDGSGYFGCLVTGPDFGCIKHEPKE